MSMLFAIFGMGEKGRARVIYLKLDGEVRCEAWKVDAFYKLLTKKSVSV